MTDAFRRRLEVSTETENEFERDSSAPSSSLLNASILDVSGNSSSAPCRRRNGISRFVTFSTMQYRLLPLSLSIRYFRPVSFASLSPRLMCSVFRSADAAGRRATLSIVADVEPASSPFPTVEEYDTNWISGVLRVAGRAGPFTAIHLAFDPRATLPDSTVITSPNSRKRGQPPSSQVTLSGWSAPFSPPRRSVLILVCLSGLGLEAEPRGAPHHERFQQYTSSHDSHSLSP